MSSLESRWFSALVDFKVLFIMYFGAGVFLSMAADLFFIRAGVLSTALLWQILLAAALSALLHALFYPENAAKPIAARALLHGVLMYALMLLLTLMFGWMPLGVLPIVIFTGVFLLIYAGLFFTFTLVYRARKQRLNDQLAVYKNKT